jgi:peptidoglycan hydrolase-like protein with peptidoglycan-binding domain
MSRQVRIWLCAIFLVTAFFGYSTVTSSPSAHAATSGLSKLATTARARKCPPFLSYGDIDKKISGPVYLLQASLNHYAGVQPNWPALSEDGNFGSRTLAAVKRFQRLKGLVVDGLVGPKTWHALDWC